MSFVPAINCFAGTGLALLISEDLLWNMQVMEYAGCHRT